MYTTESMYWICVIALFAFSLLFNVCFILALTYLNRKFVTVCLTWKSLSLIQRLTTFFNLIAAFGDSKTIIADVNDKQDKKKHSSNLRIPTESTSASTAPVFEGLGSDLFSSFASVNLFIGTVNFHACLWCHSGLVPITEGSI